MLSISLCKTKGSFNLSFVEDIFVERTNLLYDLGNSDNLLETRTNITVHGIETIQYAGSTIWQTLPSEKRVYHTRNLQGAYKKLEYIQMQLQALQGMYSDCWL